MLAEDIAKLMAMIPLDEEIRRNNDADKIRGGAFDQVMETKTPFMFKGGEGLNAGIGEVEWVVAKDRFKYDATFDSLNPIDGKVSGASAKSKLINKKQVSKTWGLRLSKFCSLKSKVL